MNEAEAELATLSLDLIDEAELPRDRVHLDPEAMAELEASIFRSGLRMPIEVVRRTDPDADAKKPYVLISGYRRLVALRQLREKTGLDRYASVRALVRPKSDVGAVLVAMVEENEIRAPLSPWERGALAARLADAGYYDGPEQAVEALFPHASRQKRARLRAVAHAADALGSRLTAPHLLSERGCLRLAAAVAAGFGDIIAAALAERPRAGGPAQWEAMLPYIEESEALAPTAKPIRDRPRRLVRTANGLTFRRQTTPGGYAIHVAGKLATEALTDDLLGHLEQMFEPVR